MPQAIADRIKVIDVDTHVSEPYDLWTSRVSTKKWGDKVPHVVFDPEIEADRWKIAGRMGLAVGRTAIAGWDKPLPSHPPTLQDADPGCYDTGERLKRMDEYGIYAQILYPNVGGFGSGNFLELEERPLMLDCIRAYNDFLSEWSSADPQRLIPIMAMPFWDVDACVAEMHRSAKLGHKGVLMTNQPHVFGFPAITDPRWNPLWESAQELDLPINFHIGSGDLLTTVEEATVHNGKQAAGSKNAVLFFLDNSVAVLDVILSGICHRYPKLKFVSVESGIGWVPFVLEAADWQWNNSGAIHEHPEMDLLPSEYFKRQVYACFWFEEASAVKAIEQIGSENVLYETDYPHPTSMSPGGGSIARVPKDQIEHALSGLPERDLRNILHDNAAALYHLDV